MADFDGKVALVTGSGSGIGRSIAELFAEQGAKVVVSDVDDEGGEETVKRIKDAGGDAIYVQCDVSDPAAVEALVKKTTEQYGRLDAAVNNAGIGGDQMPPHDMTVENWQRVISINLSGPFYGIKYQVPAMLENDGGAIVNIASILGQVGFPGASAYVSAKHGLVGLTKNAALEYAAQGVRVNSVGPAFIRTPLISALEDDPDSYNMLVSLHPIGRLGEPREVAEMVVWLCSDKASFVTGAYYPVDGGYLAR
ncbi:MAG: SDR family oxidoreductase [Chloroflexi bacterium]|nr:SDR family oxidoreductase [Chloroflexota bacterium]